MGTETEVKTDSNPPWQKGIIFKDRGRYAALLPTGISISSSVFHHRMKLLFCLQSINYKKIKKLVKFITRDLLSAMPKLLPHDSPVSLKDADIFENHHFLSLKEQYQMYYNIVHTRNESFMTEATSSSEFI